ncbi:TIGR04282 family arsenosugar biosynthesis glycosyltransferase [Marinilongibacter aquaticus]|uniref:TIGR04282 family arsenosugar biosynthesis glycosyltransferase n=1 Tax=Marinilongibacter aquaticus TaxID=2975157 RepID=UPI0021BD126A|nr:TIGR04282 family arsenosugar biosynthesis glycosyltransferase [Marinilongibacter aquaticus]UBM60857.1 TIGR04282 family arsenosugar biosynthesis glycosyltransferase [Marinilongibacter aquaticus]
MYQKYFDLDKALLIFIKNPQLGKAKTRLAATVGDEKALEIYKHLLAHTRSVAQSVVSDRHLFYSQFVDQNDSWPSTYFQKHLQDPHPDLGTKMFAAFGYTLTKNYAKALIIGSDCLELSPEIVESAFSSLQENDLVIGPAKDGGYYSIGFNFDRIGEASSNLLKAVFLEKTWSHDKVFQEAVESIKPFGLRLKELPLLSDVDVADDVKHLL